MSLYGAESWTLSKDIAEWLATFELLKEVLRGMFGGIKLHEM